MNLVANWIDATEAQLRGIPLTGKREEAVVGLLELVSDDPEGALGIVRQIIERKPSDRVLNCLGAGPVEELLIKHPEFLGKLIGGIVDSNSLRECLLHVDADGDSELEKKLKDFLGSKGSR